MSITIILNIFYLIIRCFFSGLLVVNTYFDIFYDLAINKFTKPLIEQQIAKCYPPKDVENFSPIRDLRDSELKALSNQPIDKDYGIKLSASSAIAIDVDGNEEIFSQHPDEVQSIASITKLMTSLVFLDYNPGWDKFYTFKETDKRSGGKDCFFAGDKVKVKDLFYAMLVASDNSAVISLINSAGLTEGEFVKKMNEKAQELGLNNTHFFDPTGLHNGNVSTAREVAKFARLALDKEEIKDAVLTRKYKFETEQGKQKVVFSTDQMLKNNDSLYTIEGGKTGYLNSAGYCFVGKFKNDKQELVTVVLGAADKDARFEETKKMLNWVYENQ